MKIPVSPCRLGAQPSCEPGYRGLRVLGLDGDGESPSQMCVCINKQIYIYVYMYTHTFMYENTYIHLHTYIYIHIHIYAHVHIYICVCIYTHNAYTPMATHTQTAQVQDGVGRSPSRLKLGNFSGDHGLLSHSLGLCCREPQVISATVMEIWRGPNKHP